MTVSEGLRLLEPEEFTEMMELLDRYFACERGGMQARIPMTYDTDHADYHAVVVEDGRIVSHAAAVPQTLSTGAGTVECWGISGVATDRRYRGNGYMTRLLEFWFDRMDDRGVPLSDLGGNRQRYAHFGYENAGTEYEHTVSERSFAGEPSASPAVVGYEPAEHLETLREIHEAEQYRVVRDRAASRTLFGQRGLETLVYDDATEPAYVSLTRESRSRTIEEFGGSEAGLETLLSHVLAVMDLNDLSVRVPPWHPLESTFARHSRFWTARPHRKLRICDLPALLQSFQGQLEERWTRSGRTEEGSIEIGAADGDAVQLSYGPEAVTVEPTAGAPDVELERTALTSLLFGMSGRTDTLREGDALLETALPLEFFLWPTEHV